jgi:regulator-associated protein of mTOR
VVRAGALYVANNAGCPACDAAQLFPPLPPPPPGELNWVFTAITDTIAWNVLPRALFQKLFRQVGGTGSRRPLLISGGRFAARASALACPACGWNPRRTFRRAATWTEPWRASPACLPLPRCVHATPAPTPRHTPTCAWLAQDLLVASLFRNFLLAERIMRAANCTPVRWAPAPACRGFEAPAACMHVVLLKAV